MSARIRVLSADDEPAGRRTVQLLLAADQEIELVGQCRSGPETVEAVLRLRPDLLFLDVQMPDADGFAVLAQIPADAMPLIVFVTAFDEYAVKAFDVHAADYLLKPFSDTRFRAAVARAKEQLAHRTVANADRLAALLGRLGAGMAAGASPAHRALERVAIQTSEGARLLAVDDIEWIEARGDYVRIHVNGGVELLRESISRLEERLDPSRFVRVHRSAIVNLARVIEIKTSLLGDCVAILNNGSVCKLSRSGRDRLGKALGQRI